MSGAAKACPRKAYDPAGGPGQTALPWRADDSVDPAAISYAVCEPADVPEIVVLLAHSFAANDPPARAVGLTPEDLQAYLEWATRTAAVDGLTIVARVAASGQLAGTVLVLDGSTPPPHTDGLSPTFEPLMGIFGELDTQLCRGIRSTPRTGGTAARAVTRRLRR